MATRVTRDQESSVWLLERKQMLPWLSREGCAVYWQTRTRTNIALKVKPGPRSTRPETSSNLVCKGPDYSINLCLGKSFNSVIHSIFQTSQLYLFSLCHWCLCVFYCFCRALWPALMRFCPKIRSQWSNTQPSRYETQKLFQTVRIKSSRGHLFIMLRDRVINKNASCSPLTFSADLIFVQLSCR